MEEGQDSKTHPQFNPKNWWICKQIHRTNTQLGAIHTNVCRCVCRKGSKSWGALIFPNVSRKSNSNSNSKGNSKSEPSFWVQTKYESRVWATNYIEMLIIQLLRRAVQKKDNLTCKRIFIWRFVCHSRWLMTLINVGGIQSIWSIPFHISTFAAFMCLRESLMPAIWHCGYLWQ